MAFKDMLSLCGRIGLIMAAFAFVAGIVAGPLLGKGWASRFTITGRGRPPAPALAKAPGGAQPAKQG